MRTKPFITLFVVLGTAALVSCESKQEEVREDKLENKADAMEGTADQVRKNAETAADATENNAEAIREEAERKADALEEKADDTRDAK